MTIEGPQLAWFSDLTIPDPYYTLPLTSSLVLLLTIELNAADGLQVSKQLVFFFKQRSSLSLKLQQLCVIVRTDVMSHTKG